MARAPFRLFALCLGLMAPLPAAAQSFGYCEEAWVIRNMVFDRLGYCFSSVTGQMLFDNSDCTGRNVTPTGADAEIVQRIGEGEEFNACQINTAAPPTPALRAAWAHFSRFIDLPIPDEVGGYACWGYKGPAFPVRAGASHGAPVLGTAQTGQSVVTTYWGRPGGWEFVEITNEIGGAPVLTGWIHNVDISPDRCDMVAG